MRLTLLIFTALFLAAGCKSSSSEKTSPDFLAKNVDTTVHPADDFFEYALGNWLKNTPIPEAESSWGIANLVQEEIYTRLRKINEDAAQEKSTSGVQQKIGDFWYSGMDTLSIEQQGLKPLAADLDRINRMQTINDIVDVTADLHIKGIGVLFTDYVAQDDKNSEVYAFQMAQGGLGMPNRDYYFNNDERTSGVRKAYNDYLVKTFMQLGNDSIAARANAKSVLDLETAMAKNSRKLADLRDPYLNYNKMAISSLAQLSPNFAWTNYLSKTRVLKIDSVIVGQPEFYKALNTLLTTTPVEVWKNYLRFHLVRASAPYLDSRSFENFFIYRKSLTGTSQPRPRWKRVLDAEEQAIGEALGQIFVKEYFNEKAKKRYSDLVENIRDAYRERIEKLT